GMVLASPGFGCCFWGSTAGSCRRCAV
ncbi:hypothetical protein AVDCRST_MAG84-3136, partial [uncultured Microcoleus sp.]